MVESDLGLQQPTAFSTSGLAGSLTRRVMQDTINTIRSLEEESIRQGFSSVKLENAFINVLANAPGDVLEAATHYEKLQERDLFEEERSLEEQRAFDERQAKLLASTELGRAKAYFANPPDYPTQEDFENSPETKKYAAILDRYSDSQYTAQRLKDEGRYRVLNQLLYDSGVDYNTKVQKIQLSGLSQQDQVKLLNQLNDLVIDKRELMTQTRSLESIAYDTSLPLQQRVETVQRSSVPLATKESILKDLAKLEIMPKEGGFSGDEARIKADDLSLSSQSRKEMILESNLSPQEKSSLLIKLFSASGDISDIIGSADPKSELGRVKDFIYSHGHTKDEKLDFIETSKLTPEEKSKMIKAVDAVIAHDLKFLTNKRTVFTDLLRGVTEKAVRTGRSEAQLAVEIEEALIPYTTQDYIPSKDPVVKSLISQNLKQFKIQTKSVGQDDIKFTSEMYFNVVNEKNVLNFLKNPETKKHLEILKGFKTEKEVQNILKNSVKSIIENVIYDPQATPELKNLAILSAKDFLTHEETEEFKTKVSPLTDIDTSSLESLGENGISVERQKARLALKSTIDQALTDLAQLRTSVQYSPNVYLARMKSVTDAYNSILQNFKRPNYDPKNDDVLLAMKKRADTSLTASMMSASRADQSRTALGYLANPPYTTIEDFLKSDDVKRARSFINLNTGDRFQADTAYNTAQQTIIETAMKDSSVSINEIAKMIDQAELPTQTKARLITQVSELQDKRLKELTLNSSLYHTRYISLDHAKFRKSNPVMYHFLSEFFSVPPSKIMGEVKKSIALNPSEFDKEKLAGAEYYAQLAMSQIGKNVYDYVYKTGNQRLDLTPVEGELSNTSARLLNAAKQYSAYGTFDFFSSADLTLLKKLSISDLLERYHDFSEQIQRLGSNPLVLESLNTTQDTSIIGLNSRDRVGFLKNKMSAKLNKLFQGLNPKMTNYMLYDGLIPLNDEADFQNAETLFSFLKTTNRSEFNFNENVFRGYEQSAGLVKNIKELARLGHFQNYTTDSIKADLEPITDDDLQVYLDVFDNPYHTYGAFFPHKTTFFMPKYLNSSDTSIDKLFKLYKVGAKMLNLLNIDPSGQRLAFKNLDLHRVYILKSDGNVFSISGKPIVIDLRKLDSLYQEIGG